MRRVQVSTIAVAVAAILAASQSARAQEISAAETEAATAGVEVIVVTAQRREESIQDVPLSVQAFSGQALEQAGIDSVLDLPRLVPNFNVARGTQTSNVRLSIRGVGAAGNSAIDPSIGTFIDGVYVPRPGSLFGAMNDLASAEVLRGPQGTLFGRNSTVGGVLLTLGRPRGLVRRSHRTAVRQLWAKEVCRHAGRCQPVIDLAFRIAGLTDSHDGYAHNRFDNKDFVTSDTSAVRVGMNWAITDSLNWTLKYDTSKIGGDGKAELEIDPEHIDGRFAGTSDCSSSRGNPPDLDDAFDRKSNQRITGKVDDSQWGLVSDLTLGYRWRQHGAVPERLPRLGERATRVRRACSCRQTSLPARARMTARASRTNCN